MEWNSPSLFHFWSASEREYSTLSIVPTLPTGRVPLASCWVGTKDGKLPNQRLKLTARGGRVVGNGSVLSAAAAGRSLSAIR